MIGPWYLFILSLCHLVKLTFGQQKYIYEDERFLAKGAKMVKGARHSAEEQALQCLGARPTAQEQDLVPKSKAYNAHDQGYSAKEQA